MPKATTTAPETIALIAHDGKKDDMIHFAQTFKSVLAKYNIIATGTTGSLLQAQVGLTVEQMASGPIGGDAQIAARVVDGKVQGVFFFVDPLGKHPHDPEIQMLLRLCNVHNIPLATNTATAYSIIAAMELSNAQDETLRELHYLKSYLKENLTLDYTPYHDQED